MTPSDDLDSIFAALANPTRRAMLARLAQGDASVNQLAEPFDMSLPAISKHLGVLEKAGLIQRGRNAQFRPCSLNAEPLAAVANWASEYRHVWAHRFDAMSNLINMLQEQDDVK